VDDINRIKLSRNIETIHVDSDGQTPIQTAAEEGHTGMVELLDEIGSSPNLGGMSSILRCIVRTVDTLAQSQIRRNHETSSTQIVRQCLDLTPTELVILLNCRRR
jgi:ankyrin repeat protein